MARSGSHMVEEHQREMVRLHELWQQSKAELREKSARVDHLERTLRDSSIAPGRSGHTSSHVAALHQVNADTFELRDKLRFTELQLAASREEVGQLAGTRVS